MSDKVSIGIDPGKDGGYAVIWEGGKAETAPWDNSAFITKMEDVVTYTAIENLVLVCCVEKVGAMPAKGTETTRKQGATSTFTFGKSAGFIEGVLQTLHIPYQLVPPQTWKKEFQLNASKQKSVDVCKKLFPDVSLLRTEKCRKDHDGMAESLLMATYAKRKL